MRDDNECDAYVNYLLAEHRRLHRLVAQTRTSIVHSCGPDRDTSFADVARVLQSLRAELVRHFAEEEAGGCLEEAASRYPHLSAEVKRIEAEHGMLLASLDRALTRTLKPTDDEASRKALAQDFDELYRQLHAHENAENKLMKQAFGSAFDEDDNTQPTLLMDT